MSPVGGSRLPAEGSREPRVSVSPSRRLAVELSGAMPALVTPMSAPGVLDLPALAAATERAHEQGASGVVVAGTTGEGTLLSPADRRAVTAAAVQTSVPVIAGASGATLDDLHADVARLGGTGVEAVMVLAPSYQPLTDEELVDVHVAVAVRSEVSTIVYNIPQFTRTTLITEAVRALAGHRNIVGIKDSSPDHAHREGLIAAAKDRLGVFVGDGASLGAALRSGAAGSITAIANLRMEDVVALHQAVADNDDARASSLQASLSAMEAALVAAPASLAATVKAALQLQGWLDERYCVPPLRSVSGGHLDLIRTALLR